MSITIRHNDLNECLSDPSNWVRKKVSKQRNFYSIGYERILRESIFKFHNKNDYVSGKDNIEVRLERNKLQNQPRVDNVMNSYDQYVLWVKNEHITVVKARHKVHYELGNDVVLGGTISTIDITPTGYRGLLLGRIPKDWELELRMPLLQRALAFEFGRHESQFVVGWQDLNTTSLETKSFETSIIENAEARIRELAKEVANEYKRQTQ